MAELWFGCFEYYHAYKSGNTFNDYLWPNYGLDVLNITMHTKVAIHPMTAYVWCWSKVCGSLDEIPCYNGKLQK